MEDILKHKIPNFYKLISIEKSNTGKHNVYYVEVSFRYDKSPFFSVKSMLLDIKLELRDSLISDLLSSREVNNDISVDEDLFTDEQRDRIQKLRDKKVSNRSNILESKIEWSNQFKVGDRVYYKGLHCIITFKHQMKSNRMPQEWSVVCGDTEYRYVTGSLLVKREVRDLSNIPIDKELDKLTTERLLKMYKRSLKVGKGNGNQKIKRILNQRENLNKIEKVINVR